jgi:outer membrane protein assembly factor BamB
VKRNGKLKWKFPIVAGGGIFSSPAIAADGTIYINSIFLYAISSDGTLKWAFPIGVSYSSPTVGPDGTVYTGSSDSNLDGTLKWTFQFPVGRVDSSPAVGKDGTIYFGLNGAYFFYALNPDGTQKMAVSNQGQRTIVTSARSRRYDLFRLGRQELLRTQPGWHIEVASAKHFCDGFIACD